MQLRVREFYSLRPARIQPLSSLASNRRTLRCCVWVITVLVLGTRCSSAAEPYVPADDNEVLETLPRSLLSGRDEIDTLRQRLSQDPTNVELAAIVATRCLQIGKDAAEPRFYGYAQKALAPWLDDANPPNSILKSRAKLKEREHRYDEALVDLQQALKQQPQDAQLCIELANIYWVQGKYSDAQEMCQRVGQFAGQAPTVMCSAPVLAVTGKAEQAYTSLVRILPIVRQDWPAAVQWLYTMQAETAWALGRFDVAERHFREALTNDPTDDYVLRAYADFLLDQDRAAEVVALLRPYVSDTGILMPAAIAAQRAGEQKLTAAWRSQLADRFAENRLRGNPPHGRYEARYELELTHDFPRSLKLALENWRQQKQPADTRLLLEAALAAGDTTAAQPALDFLKQHGTQHVMLERLVEKLERQ